MSRIERQTHTNGEKNVQWNKNVGNGEEKDIVAIHTAGTHYSDKNWYDLTQ